MHTPQTKNSVKAFLMRLGVLTISPSNCTSFTRTFKLPTINILIIFKNYLLGPREIMMLDQEGGSAVMNPQT